MLLVNPLSKNKTFETFNTRKTRKANIDFSIFSLICKTFYFASTNQRDTNADLKIC